jgi:hypothetical protein
MRAAFQAWATDRGVLPVAEDYNQGQTVLSKGLRNRPGFLFGLGLATLAPVALILLLVVWWVRRRRAKI